MPSLTPPLLWPFPPLRPIPVHTRTGRPLPTYEAPTPDQRLIDKDERLYQQFRNVLRRRKPATGIYNCAGHVWASRRTALGPHGDTRLDDVIQQIIDDDGYRVLRPGEAPQPGDLVIYDGQDPSVGFLHVGEIIAVQDLLAEGSEMKVAHVLSKFDDSSGEYVHIHTQHPFNSQLAPRFKFMTDRP